MSKYVRQFEVTIPFDDDQITAVLKSATVEQLLAIDTTSDDAIVRSYAKVLDQALVELRGPLDACGIQVPKDEFLSVNYFAVAVMEIGAGWLKRSVPGKQEKSAA